MTNVIRFFATVLQETKSRINHLSRRLKIFFFLFLIMSMVTQTGKAFDITIDHDNPAGLDGAISAIIDGSVLYLNPGTYKGTNNRGVLIYKSITIHGNGAADQIVIDAEELSHIFHIYDGTNVTFENITFRNGKNTGGNGGAVRNVHANSQLTFKNCIFINNTAEFGGAIYNAGTGLSVTGCTFIGNTASNEGSAIYNSGNDAKIWYNRFVNNSGHAVFSTGANGNANFNWWGSNADPAVSSVNGLSVTNRMVMTLSYNDLDMSIVNTSFSKPVGNYELSYYFFLYTPFTGDLELIPQIDFLPDFNVDLTWYDKTGTVVHSLTNVSAKDHYFHNVYLGPNGDYTLKAVCDNEVITMNIHGDGLMVDTYLFLTKTADVQQVVLGDAITFTISLTNNGPNFVGDVIVHEQLPSSLDYVDSYTTKGYYNSTTGEWLIGHLSLGETVDLEVVARVNQIGDIINTVFVTMDNNNIGNTSASVTIKQETCSVTYHANGGEGQLTDPKSPYLTDVLVTVLSPHYYITKPGFDFSGWNTQPDGSGISYKAGNTFPIQGDMVFYAQWQEVITPVVQRLITIDPTVNGLIKADKQYAKTRDTVKLVIQPNAGYALESIKVRHSFYEETTVPLKGDGDTRYFLMPPYVVTVSATFQPFSATGNNSPFEGGRGMLRAWTQNGLLFVSGLQPGTPWSIYSLIGTLEYTTTAIEPEATIPLPKRGIFIVKHGSKAIKVIH